MSDGVSAYPAKAFFVKMLTRDISLEDAIMDLIDNCTDGILRTKWKDGIPEGQSKPYAGYYAKVSISGDLFSIEDNCGGIPKNIAEEYAFRMGRANKRDGDLPTVGVYGIGMKRALFKMGSYSTVFSKTDECSFEVTIDSDWLEDDQQWRLPLKIYDEVKKEENGTIIKVADLYQGISEQFSSQVFIGKLITLIQQHYSYIIQKGFQISINDTVIEPIVMKLLIDDNFERDSLAPYIYKADMDGVSVFLQVGFYRRLPNQDEIDQEQVARSSKEEAGWTIICNDRVVVYKDKSILTGWGDANVPQYHTQFIGITGLVIFKSDDVEKLPITTTKRGIDASSLLYLRVKNRMREGLKIFTDYTNKWKKDTQKELEMTVAAKPRNILELEKEIPRERWTKIQNTNFTEYRFQPKLPRPSESNPNKYIRFARPESDLRIVSEYLFDSSDVSPSEIGEKCFDKVLKEAKTD